MHNHEPVPPPPPRPNKHHYGAAVMSVYIDLDTCLHQFVHFIGSNKLSKDVFEVSPNTVQYTIRKIGLGFLHL